VQFPSSNALNITGDITVEAWIKVASFAPNYVQGSFVCKHGWSAGEKGYVLRTGGNGILAFAIAGIDDHGTPVSWKEVVSQSGALQLNTWHHVAGTFDGHHLKLYVDGNQVASRGFKGTIDPSLNYDLKIGRIADNNTADKRYFNGWIDDVRIWNEALSRTTISAEMNSQVNPASANLIAYWELNDGSGTGVTGGGTAACNGILMGAQWDTDVPFTNGIPRPLITSVGNSLVSSSLTGNQWNLNGVPIPGENGVSYSPVTGGDYSVTVNYGLGCSATSDIYTVVVAGISGIENEIISVQSSQPGIFQIRSNAVFRKVHVTVFDITGRVIYASGDISRDIDISGNQRGIYLLTILYDGHAFSRKIVLT
jgi:hypothetical protein